MRALALISGGLDSALAAMVIKNLGVEVIGLHFEIPFYTRKKRAPLDIGIEIRQVDISEEFLVLLTNPRYGFGSHMNPCIDCKILMLKKANDLLKEWDAQFIITGEVLAQRPMSQHRQALELIPRRAGAGGLVVRPLCAQHLPETIPEQQGWIDRSKLLNFSGRGRTAQFELARRLGLKEYAQPGGGCLLTDPLFALRLKELMAHNEVALSNIKLLKTGRHFRVGAHAKLILGRNEAENNALLRDAAAGDYLFYPDEVTPGPVALARGAMDENLIRLCAQITARYCDRKSDSEIAIQHKAAHASKVSVLRLMPVAEDALMPLKI